MSMCWRELSRPFISSFFIAFDVAFSTASERLTYWLAAHSLWCRNLFWLLLKGRLVGTFQASFWLRMWLSCFGAWWSYFQLFFLPFQLLWDGLFQRHRDWRMILFQLLSGTLFSTHANDMIEGISFFRLAPGKEPVLLLVNRFTPSAIVVLDHVYCNNQRIKPVWKKHYLTPS